MPNKSIYISEEDMPLFQKAQELAGESLSKVIVEALRQYIIKKETECSEYKEIVVWRGEEHYPLNSSNIEKSKFIGKEISSETMEDPYERNSTVGSRLYVSLKGKLLLWWIKCDGFVSEADFEVYENLNELYGKGLSPKMLSEAEKKLGKSHIKFLDI